MLAAPKGSRQLAAAAVHLALNGGPVGLKGGPMSEPQGRGVAWTEERGTSDEGRRRLKAPRRRAGDTVTVRVEHDSMGDVEVPADALWGAQTQRAVENFPVSGERIGRDLIGALASIKGGAAVVNGRLGVLHSAMAEAIHDAAAGVALGGYDDQFPIDVFQTGSGTSSNMNANEVIAALA